MSECGEDQVRREGIAASVEFYNIDHSPFYSSTSFNSMLYSRFTIPLLIAVTFYSLPYISLPFSAFLIMFSFYSYLFIVFHFFRQHFSPPRYILPLLFISIRIIHSFFQSYAFLCPIFVHFYFTFLFSINFSHSFLTSFTSSPSLSLSPSLTFLLFPSS